MFVEKGIYHEVIVQKRAVSVLFNAHTKPVLVNVNEIKVQTFSVEQNDERHKYIASETKFVIFLTKWKTREDR
jgi:hypothetical protein